MYLCTVYMQQLNLIVVSVQSTPVITAEDFQSMKAIDDNNSIILLDVRQKEVFDIRYRFTFINSYLCLL